MKYKIGDKVRVKSHEENQKTMPYVGGAMRQLCGRVCTISYASGDTYKLEEDVCGFYWSAGNFEAVPVTETKYKAGDVVTVRSDLTNKYYYMANGKNYMKPTDQMLTKAGKKVKIKSVTKSGKYMIEGSIFPWVDEMFESEVVTEASKKTEPKKTKAVTFKIGDKVVAKMDAPYSITKPGWTGKVVECDWHGNKNYILVKGEGVERCPVLAEHFDLLEEPKPNTWELVIRGEGDKTVAEYICEDIKTTAVVHRFFEDQFSIRKAVEAVTNKVVPEEKWVVSVKFDSGSKTYDYLTTDNTINVGDKLVVPAGRDCHHVPVTATKIKPFAEYTNSCGVELKYIVRKCDGEDDVITYYNGKVVCVYATPTSAYIVGKIYNVVDGQIRLNATNYAPKTPVKTFKDFEEMTHGIANFVEIVE